MVCTKLTGALGDPGKRMSGFSYLKKNTEKREIQNFYVCPNRCSVFSLRLPEKGPTVLFAFKI